MAFCGCCCCCGCTGRVVPWPCWAGRGVPVEPGCGVAPEAGFFGCPPSFVAAMVQLPVRRRGQKSEVRGHIRASGSIIIVVIIVVFIVVVAIIIVIVIIIFVFVFVVEVATFGGGDLGGELGGLVRAE